MTEFKERKGWQLNPGADQVSWDTGLLWLSGAVQIPNQDVPNGDVKMIIRLGCCPNSATDRVPRPVDYHAPRPMPAALGKDR